MDNRNKGILLMNLGSPDSTEVADVKKYLDEFLMDGKVIDMPYLLRLLVVKGFITPRRAKHSAEAYKTIWTSQGSPLVVITKQVKEELTKIVDVPVEIAMRYGNPSPEEGFNNLVAQEPGLTEVIAIPLYPHYAMSSYETAVEHAKKIHSSKGYKFSLDFVQPYYNNDHYIDALADSMRQYVQKEYDHLLFSYHGIPARHLHKTDPTGSHCMRSGNCCSVASSAHATCYRHQCFETTRLVTQKLNIPQEKFSISFQSRLGKGWLEPFTDVRLEQMPGEGIKKLLVVCPAFVSDCLETLEEIAERGKESFLEAGGQEYEMIPCMNSNPAWISTLKELAHA